MNNNNDNTDTLCDTDLYPGMTIKSRQDKTVWTLIKLATWHDAQRLQGKNPELRKEAWDKYSLKWFGKNANGKEELLCFDASITSNAYEWSEPVRTPREWAEELRRLEWERYGERKQSAVNLDYALAYERSLEEIAALLGQMDTQGLPEDIDQIALRLVKEKLKLENPPLC